MNELKKLSLELKQYSLGQKLTFFLDPAILGLVNFRISAFLYNIKFTRLLYILYWPIWRIISNLIGIEIHGGTKIGAGLRIFHFGGIFINDKSIIGENCTIYNNVTIGSKSYIGGDAPIIGNNVNIGVGTKILGGIKIGNNINIGAMTVIVKDFKEDNIVLVGNPAKVINKNK